LRARKTGKWRVSWLQFQFLKIKDCVSKKKKETKKGFDILV
jgi:hypothetical protein